MHDALDSLIAELPAAMPARSLGAWTTAVMRKAILDGYFDPGQRLDQDAIAEALGVSRTPVREAVAALESEGLVQSQPHRGVYVAEVSTTDVREVFAVRAVLEAEAAREATSRIPDSVLDELETVLDEARLAYEQGDHVAHFEADRRLHETLVHYGENELLREVLAGVNNRINAVRRFAQTRPGPHVDQFAGEHLAILQAMRERDSDRVAALMTEHLKNSQERVAELV